MPRLSENHEHHKPRTLASDRLDVLVLRAGQVPADGAQAPKDKATGLFGAFVRYLCCRDLHVQEIRAYEGGDMSFFEEPEEPQGPPPKKAVLLLLSVYS